MPGASRRACLLACPANTFIRASHCTRLVWECFEAVWLSAAVAGCRVLIFSQMVRMLNIISDYMRLRGFQHQRLDGSTPAGQRHQVRARTPQMSLVDRCHDRIRFCDRLHSLFQPTKGLCIPQKTFTHLTCPSQPAVTLCIPGSAHESILRQCFCIDRKATALSHAV